MTVQSAKNPRSLFVLLHWVTKQTKDSIDWMGMEFGIINICKLESIQIKCDRRCFSQVPQEAQQCSTFSTPEWVPMAMSLRRSSPSSLEVGSFWQCGKQILFSIPWFYIWSLVGCRWLRIVRVRVDTCGGDGLISAMFCFGTNSTLVSMDTYIDLWIKIKRFESMKESLWSDNAGHICGHCLCGRGFDTHQCP